jgi:hypothetical protein
VTREWRGMRYRDTDPSDPCPMRPGGAPPVCTIFWTEEDFERWRARNVAEQAAVDAWHARYPWRHCMEAPP